MTQHGKQQDHAVVQSKKLITMGIENTERLNLKKMAHEKTNLLAIFMFLLGNGQHPSPRKLHC